MLRALVGFAIARRSVVLTVAAAVAGYGVFLLATAGFDVFPEFAPRLVIVQTEAPGYAAEQVEVLVTAPLEAALGGLIGLDHVRSESIQGLSVVTAVFVDGSDVHRNRQQVAERLAVGRTRLPAGVGEPVIAPLASSSATVRTIGLSGAGGDELLLRDVAETVLVPRLLAVPGVADVNVFGGAERALLVEGDPARLLRHGVGIAELVRAVRALGSSRGLGVIENANQQLALVRAGSTSPAEVAAALLRDDGLAGLRIGDVAHVRWGALPRISAAQVGGVPAVVMMVIGQYGANTLTVSRALDAVFADLEPVLARQDLVLHGRLFVPANYITTALGDIGRHLLAGGALVVLVLLIGLYNLRTALISVIAIPLSLLSAVIVLVAAGVNLNILVIGGLAIALGEVVDDAIIDSENILRRLREAGAAADAAQVALEASLEVRGAVVYATFIVALVFVPLLTLGGVSGRLFAPLGLAYILAVFASLLVAVTVTPALCVSLLGHVAPAAREPPLFLMLATPYGRLVAALARRPALAVGAGCACAVAVVLAVPTFGARFLPELREGHFIVHTTALPGTSLDESIRMGTRLAEAFRAIDGVVSVSQWAGRAARGADTYGSHYSEYEVALEPLGGARQAEVLETLRDVLATYPGLSYEANTFLVERIDETVSGYTAPVVVNLYGSDLDALDAVARRLATLVAGVPGARGVRLRAAPATPTFEVRFDAERLARHGLAPATAEAALASAYGGVVVNEVVRAQRRLPVVVALPAALRADAGRLADLVLADGPGGPVRLAQVADLRQASGRYNILRRGAQRLQVVTCDVVGRDLDGFLDDLRRRALADFELPRGMHLEFTGAAMEQAAARRELVVHALLAGVAVLALVHLAVGRLRYLLIILFNLPFSLLGGVGAVLLTGGVVSVGSVVGFVTLFGITVRNSIMLVSHYTHLVEVEGAAWNLETLQRGARERLPAILMTALVTALAMLPLTLDSDNPGREIMGPMAAIIVGGLATSTLLNLLVMPALLYRYGGFARQGGTAG